MPIPIYTAHYSPWISLTDGATINSDAEQGNNFAVTLGGNRTIANPSNPKDGQLIRFRLKQDGIGLRLVTWGSAFRFAGSAPILTILAGGVNIISFVYHAGEAKWDNL